MSIFLLLLLLLGAMTSVGSEERLPTHDQTRQPAAPADLTTASDKPSTLARTTPISELEQAAISILTGGVLVDQRAHIDDGAGENRTMSFQVRQSNNCLLRRGIMESRHFR
jgi:hypothetical protein